MTLVITIPCQACGQATDAEIDVDLETSHTTTDGHTYTNCPSCACRHHAYIYLKAWPHTSTEEPP